MFMGEFQHNVDAKGRLIIPAKLRDGLGERFIATKGLEGCLFVYPTTEWEAISERMRTLPVTSVDARAFTRLFFSGATECELDPQGRILLAANLRDYAKIDRDVVIVGVSTRVEIWSAERWAEYSQKAEESYGEIAEKLLNF
ncbi:MAG: division/cell wall cluster transcriptional repressor MraZ [Mycobacterium leprae]